MHRLTSFTRPALFALLLACNGGGETTEDTGGSSTDPTPGTTADVPTTGGGPGCGDGMIDEGEDCDGADLGAKSCADVDPATPLGGLACSPGCTYDTSACMAAGAAFIALNEVASQGQDAGPFAGHGDAIELYNPGDAAVDVSGWKLSDDPGFPSDKTYVFPAGTSIAPGEYKVLVTLDDITMMGDFPFGLSSTEMETLTLAGPDDATVDQVAFLGSEATLSFCRLPDGTGAWQQCDSSLGGANLGASMICGNGQIEGDEQCEGDELGGGTCMAVGFTAGTLACHPTCKYDVSLCTSTSAVIINELESTEDLIELYNSGDDPVDISSWILTDDPAGPNYDPLMDPERLTFPAMSVLMPKTYFPVYKGDLPGQHVFGLGDGGDTVTLLMPDLTLADQVTYGAQEAAVSYCRIPDGPGTPWMADCIPTFGETNMHP